MADKSLGTSKWNISFCESLERRSGYFFSVNRGKRSIAIDLKQEEGRALFKRLVRDFDVLVENFTPGTMDGLGLGYAELSKEHPGLIYCAISGYGQTGPMRLKPALDVVIQGAGGILSVTGEPGGVPVKPGTDGAFACGVMHVLFRDGYADRAYLAEYTDSPAALEAHLATRTPAWARFATSLAKLRSVSPWTTSPPTLRMKSSPVTGSLLHPRASASRRARARRSSTGWPAPRRP